MKKIISFALVFIALLACAAFAENADVNAPQSDGAALEKSLPAPAANGDQEVRVDLKAMTRALADAPEAAAAPAKPLSGLWAVGGHAYLGAYSFDGGMYRMFFDCQFVEQGTSVFHGDPWSGQPVRWTGKVVHGENVGAEFSNVVQMIGPGQLAILYGSNPSLGPVIFNPVQLRFPMP